MHLAGVAKLFFESSGRGGLEKLAEAGSGIRESPRRKFDLKGVQGFEDGGGQFRLAHGLRPEYSIIRDSGWRSKTGFGNGVSQYKTSSIDGCRSRNYR